MIIYLSIFLVELILELSLVNDSNGSHKIDKLLTNNGKQGVLKNIEKCHFY